MDVMHVVLLVLAVVAAGGVIWLLGERARWMGEIAELRGRLEGTEREREREAVRAQAAEKELREQSVRAAALGKELEAAVRDRREDAQHATELHARELESLREQFEMQREMNTEKAATAERERARLDATLSQFKQEYERAFKAIAGDALKGNAEQLVQLAEQKLGARQAAMDQLVRPIAEALQRTDAKLAVIEAAGTQLSLETGKLVRALREPHVRGRYGEIQLRRVAELAGMSAYCDFFEQEQTRGHDGTALRPDMVVRLPSKRVVVVDAKTNIQAYLDAMSAASVDEAEKHLERFARHVSEQATALARKKYWSEYAGSPEFVVMFIPGDQFIDAALSRQPELLEMAAQQGVILASPSTLIGLLRAVAVGYREQQLADAATELRELGKELHERVAIAMSHAAKVGKAINSAAESYNDFVGSYEKRVEPTLRKFESSGVKSAKELPEQPRVVVNARGMQVNLPAAGLLPGMEGGGGESGTRGV